MCVCVSFFILVQPETGVWEAGQWEDRNAEALHHGESNQVFTRAVRWFAGLTEPLRNSEKSLMGSCIGITIRGIVSVLLISWIDVVQSLCHLGVKALFFSVVLPVFLSLFLSRCLYLSVTSLLYFLISFTSIGCRYHKKEWQGNRHIAQTGYTFNPYRNNIHLAVARKHASVPWLISCHYLLWKTLFAVVHDLEYLEYSLRFPQVVQTITITSVICFLSAIHLALSYLALRHTLFHVSPHFFPPSGLLSSSVCFSASSSSLCFLSCANSLSSLCVGVSVRLKAHMYRKPSSVVQNPHRADQNTICTIC